MQEGWRAHSERRAKAAIGSQANGLGFDGTRGLKLDLVPGYRPYPSDQALRTSDVAKAAGVNVQTLRYYEREGILPAPRRASSGYRQYGDEAVRIITFVKRAQELGFTLREAKELLRLRSAGPKRAPAARAAATAKLAAAVTAVIDQQPDPVVLVGHSRGGIVVSNASEVRAARIERAIYLAAFVIPDGEPMLATAMRDPDSLITRNLVVDERAGTHMLRREAFADALYGDCTAEDVALASALLTPEPNAPVGTPLRLSADGYGQVSRAYIECTADRGVSPMLQREMYTRADITAVRKMATSHSPFLSAPDTLVANLIRSLPPK